MNRTFNIKNQRTGWYILLIGFIMFFLLLIPLNKVIQNLRLEEQKKVQIWANAVAHKGEIVRNTQKFYDRMRQNEQVRLQQYLTAYKTIMSQPLETDLSSEKLNFYMKIISDNKSIPVIITDEFNNIMDWKNVDIDTNHKILTGTLYERFSKNKPLEYEVSGMHFKLYYTESEMFIQLKQLLDEITNSLLTEIADNMISLPVILTDSSQRKVIMSGNIPLKDFSSENIQSTIEDLKNSNTPIKITLPGNTYGYVMYKDSTNLRLLRFYPVLYGGIFVLVMIVFFVFYRTIKTSEQNLVWVGMSKETAHQIGTPLSSLTAWNELLRQNSENVAICEEIDKDIAKLQVVSQRFSQIGSIPTLKVQNIIPIIDNVTTYMSARSPKKIKFTVDLPQDREILLLFNKQLIEWAFENLIKNAMDAMQGQGSISIALEEKKDHIHIDVSDTGRGIPKSQFKKIFSPGFTTKKRGWGMGLSLVKRIIEEYHGGKIYVKSSSLGKGTTFRVEMDKVMDKNN